MQIIQIIIYANFTARGNLRAFAAVEADYPIRTELVLTVVAMETVVTDALVRAQTVASRVVRLATLTVTVTVVVITVVDCKIT